MWKISDYNMCMRITCWIPKYTNTYSEYVTFIAFPLQQCLHERDLMLRYLYIACHNGDGMCLLGGTN